MSNRTDHQVAVAAARPDQRVGAQPVVPGECRKRRRTRACRPPLLARAPAPGRVDLDEAVLNVIARVSHTSPVWPIEWPRACSARLALFLHVSGRSRASCGSSGPRAFGLGHEVRLLAPYDPDDRLARVTHRGARPQERPLPDHVVPLGRTIGFPMNGAVSNLARFPSHRRARPRAAPRGGYDRARARAERADRLLVRHRGGTRARRAPSHLLHERRGEPARREPSACGASTRS